jgi:hypothetical protein
LEALTVGLFRRYTYPARARIALAFVAFAIFGFIVGLSFTVQGGGTIDLAYHATALPVLIGTAIVLIRTPRSRALSDKGPECDEQVPSGSRASSAL